MNKSVKRGDMYYVEFTGVGSEQNGYRPALVVSNNMGNKYSKTVIVAIITGQTESKPKIPTHCLVRVPQRLGRESIVLLEQIRTIDKLRLREYLGTLDNETMKKIDTALAISVGL